MMNRNAILLVGFFMNLAAYSIVTTHLLFQSGALGIETILFIPIMVWGVFPSMAYLCQIIGIIIGLLCSAIPIRVWSRWFK